MKNQYLSAYASAVTASEMFKSISSIPLHQAYGGYDPINSVFSANVRATKEEMDMSRKIVKTKNIITSASHLGQRASQALAKALKEDTLLDISIYDLVSKTMGELAEITTEKELEDCIKFLTAIKEHKSKQ